MKNFSLYAKQSGIPEIKTVLGGFVIRHFMGMWTLITKSLGLVSLTRWKCVDNMLIICSVSPWHLVFGSAKKARWFMSRVAAQTSS